ncbi:hypothetical protein [Roseofilum casamattae]|uniref:Uncharacterized protein n=1 Tax=Roseofilum casamattae BLCC-M143 TaxID=3022442 RepID=A0ABT7BWF6_9CYAN|nr:hypothetical protein [Roseofilum casamattae]MDJ1183142.1 hypothetical protein [Roseofilum casamattae BLCC-M143]
MTQSKRILICTIAALASGILGFAIGGQLQARAQTEACDRYSWGWSHLCKGWNGPTAWLQGSGTGLWVGAVFGSFLAGVATFEPSQHSSSSATSNTDLLSIEEQTKLKQLLLLLDTTKTPENLTPEETLRLALGTGSLKSLNPKTIERLLLVLAEDAAQEDDRDRNDNC